MIGYMKRKDGFWTAKVKTPSGKSYVAKATTLEMLLKDIELRATLRGENG